MSEIDKSKATFLIILCGVCYDDEFETVGKKAVCKNCGEIDKFRFTTNIEIKQALDIVDEINERIANIQNRKFYLPSMEHEQKIQDELKLLKKLRDTVYS